MIQLLDPNLLAARLDARAASDAREGVAAKAPDGLRLRVTGQVAIVTISGGIGSGPDCNVHCGELAAMLHRVAGEDYPATVVLELDSPGGYLAGFSDVQAAMAHLAGRKHVVAAAHEIAGSLAYWLACSAHRIVATSTALVGSIGAIYTIEDTSVRAAMMGVKVLPVTDARGKLVGSPGVPQDETDVAFIRQQIAPLGARFRAAVATARGLDVNAIENLQGAAMFGPEAMAAGLVDEVVNWHEWIEALAGGEPAATLTTGQATKGAGMAAKTSSGKAAAKGARAMDVKELIAKYPDREVEIKGKVAEFARMLGEEMEANEAASAEVEPADPQDGPEGQMPEDDGAEAEAPVTMDEEQAAAEMEEGGAAAEMEEDESQAAAPATTGAAALATVDQLESLGKGDGFVVMAIKAKMTMAQASVVAASWTAVGGASGHGGPGAAGQTGSQTGGEKARGARPIGTAPAGAAAMGGGSPFLEKVAEYRKVNRCGEAAAIQAVRAQHPEEHRQWRASCQQQAAAIGQRMRGRM